MKRLLFLLLCGLVFSPRGFPARGAEVKTNKVGVMRFEVGEDLKASLGKFLSETFTSQLVGSRQYTVVDWEEIDRVLGMENKSQTVVSTDEARRMAISKCGLDKLFLGRVDKLGTKYHLTVKLLGLDLRVERMEQLAATSEDDLPETAKALAALLTGGKAEVTAARPLPAAPTAATSTPETKPAATPAARQSGADPFRATNENPWVNSLGMKFVLVPGTKVLFCIWETRLQDFEAFMKASGHVAASGMKTMGTDGWKERGHTWNNPGFVQGPSHPVCGIAWEDAKAFCRWLTAKERSEGKLTLLQEYRLPFDAEWSFAVGLGPEDGDSPAAKSGKARTLRVKQGNLAGTEAMNSNWCYWPNQQKATEPNDSFARTAPVGSFSSDGSGLFDLVGNVHEWCEDLISPRGANRVARGWSWDCVNAGSVPSSQPTIVLSGRFSFSSGSDNCGFRCVLAASSSAGQ